MYLILDERNGASTVDSGHTINRKLGDMKGDLYCYLWRRARDRGGAITMTNTTITTNTGQLATRNNSSLLATK